MKWKSLVLAVLVTGGIALPVGVAQAHPATDGGSPGMQQMHELMQQGDPGMEKMHERMHGEMPAHR